MENNRFWIFLAIGLLFGLSLEWLKSPTEEKAKVVWGIKGSGIAEDEVRANISRSHFRKIQASPPKVAGLGPAPSAPIPVVTAPPLVAPVKPVDPKAAKKKKKKKKKKADAAKDKAAGLDVTNNNADKPPLKMPKIPSSPAVYVNVVNPTSGPNAQSTPAPIVPAQKTLQEWENYMLKGAYPARTAQLIKNFKAGRVSADVFHKTVGQMLSDHRENVKEQGVIALAAAPSLQSFEDLVHFIASDKTATPSHTQAQTAEQNYATVQYFNVLLSGLQAPNDLTTNFESLRLIQVAANTYLMNGTALPPGQQPNQPTTSSVSRYFNPFVGTLTQMSQSAKDATLRQAAGMTLESLQQLLGTAQQS